MTQSGPNFNLTITPGIVKFPPGLIECDMPYSGWACNSEGYVGDKGMRFSRKQDGYIFDEMRKNYLISATVRPGNDTCKWSLSLSCSGSAALSVTATSVQKFPVLWRSEKQKQMTDSYAFTHSWIS